MAHVQYSITDLYDQPPLEQLLYASSATYGADWISMFHSHSFSELFFVVDGEGEFCTEETTVPLHKDMLIIINPNVRHTEKSSVKKPLTYIVLGIDNLQFEFSNSTGIGSSCIYDFHNYHSKIIPILTMILEELKSKQESHSQICQHLLSILLFRIRRITGDSFSSFSNKNIPGECQNIKYYIDSHYQEDLTLDSLAAIAHLNKFYFSHIFSDAYGISPINYLLERRILRSKDLLKNSDFSITQIASVAGFSSPNYFSQAFKKSTGFTPRAYRMKYNRNTADSKKAE